MKSSAKIVEQIRKALADPESVKYDALKAIAKEYGEACNRLNLGLTKAVVYYSTGNHSEAARILKEGNLLNEYQTLLFPELEAWREVCQMFGWKYTAYVSTVNGEKLKKFIEEYERKDDSGQVAASARSEAPKSWELLGLTPEETPKSRASGKVPNQYNRKDDVFLGAVDNGDNNTLVEGYVLEESTDISYMPPSQKKSAMIWVLIGSLAGLVILTIASLTLWLMLESKSDEPSNPSEPTTETAEKESSSEKESAKEKTEDISGDKEDDKSPSPKGGAESDEGTNPPTDEKADGKTEQAPSNETESEPAEVDSLPKEEPEQHTAKPDVLKLEEQWNKLKAEKNFDRTVLFIEGQRIDIAHLYRELNDNISTSKTFLKNYDEHKSWEIESITNLCDQIADAQTAAENLTNKFDIELFQKNCGFAVQGMDQIIALYNAALSDKDLEHRSSTLKGMNDALIKAHFAEAKSKSSDDKSDNAKKDEEIDNLAGELTPIRDEIDSIYQRSKKEFVDDLNGIIPRSSEFPEIRRILEQEILAFIVQTVNSENSFSTFTKNLKGSKKVPVNFGETVQELFAWDFVGDNEYTRFRKGLAAYMTHCPKSQNQWICSLTFVFNKTDEIDAQDKTVVFIPGNKDGDVFNVDVKGKPVSLGVKMSAKEGRVGRLDFYISDPQSIPAILRSARVSMSFTSKTDPESIGFKSDFCQLHKPIDMTKITNVESDDFFMNCAFISESDYNKLDNSAKRSTVNSRLASETASPLCVVACDRKNKIEDETGSYSLKLDVTDSLEMNSDKEPETNEERRILLLFSRQTDKDYEGATVVYRSVYAHGKFKALRRF